jgi:hypothetical protein
MPRVFIALVLLGLVAAVPDFVPPLAQCSLFVSSGTGVRGNAYSRLRTITTVDACCAACESDASCGAFELTPQAGTLSCNLKNVSEIGANYNDPNTTSGRRPPPPAPKCPGQRPPPKTSTATKATKLPHILMFLQDDLGHDDVSFTNSNPVNMDVTANITAAAKEGIVLKRHYVHWHCSPTRRTFLTGRLPLHHSEFLSQDATDDIDLRWATIAQKVKSAGYMAYWYGKGHTGFKSYNHLPLQLGFDDFVGFLGGAEDHFTGPRWSGNCPQDPKNGTYSAQLFGELALARLEEYDPTASGAKPLFFYLPWQNVRRCP